MTPANRLILAHIWVAIIAFGLGAMMAVMQALARAGIELPFGGVKQSGHGREKGFEALYGFSTLKTVAIHHG